MKLLLFLLLPVLAFAQLKQSYLLQVDVKDYKQALKIESYLNSALKDCGSEESIDLTIPVSFSYTIKDVTFSYIVDLRDKLDKSDLFKDAKIYISKKQNIGTIEWKGWDIYPSTQNLKYIND